MAPDTVQHLLDETESLTRSIQAKVRRVNKVRQTMLIKHCKSVIEWSADAERIFENRMARHSA